MDDHMKIYLELLSKMSDEQFEAHKSIIEEIHSSGGVLSQDEPVSYTHLTLPTSPKV